MLIHPYRTCSIGDYKLTANVETHVPEHVGNTLIMRGYARKVWTPPAPQPVEKRGRK